MKRLILVGLLNAITLSVFSQKMGVNIKSFPALWNNESTEYFYGGGGMEIFYDHPLQKGNLRSGFEFRSINWGNQLSLNVGYQATYLVRNRWRLNGITSAGIGLALFREKPLLVWSAEYMPEFNWRSKKRFNFSIGLGVRYTQSPKYKDYGKINQVLELPFKVGFGFNLRTEK